MYGTWQTQNDAENVLFNGPASINFTSDGQFEGKMWGRIPDALHRYRVDYTATQPPRSRNTVRRARRGASRSDQRPRRHRDRNTDISVDAQIDAEECGDADEVVSASPAFHVREPVLEERYCTPHASEEPVGGFCRTGGE